MLEEKCTYYSYYSLDLYKYSINLYISINIHKFIYLTIIKKIYDFIHLKICKLVAFKNSNKDRVYFTKLQ